MDKDFDDFVATLTEKDYIEMVGGDGKQEIKLVNFGTVLLTKSAIFSINLLRRYHEWLSN